MTIGESRPVLSLCLLPLLLCATALSPATPRETHRQHSARAAAFWKPNTHIFAANKALDDAVADGKVTIPPYGAIAVNPEALRAIKAFPDAYRAGVVGPDVFPDIYVGQSFVHVDRSRKAERWVSDDWLRHIFLAARSWPDGAGRDRALAYAYGFLTHASGDLFAHSYVNHKVGGAWDYSKDSTVYRHIVLESYVGEHTPPTTLTTDVWPRFVSEALIKDPAVRAHTQAAVHYQRFLAIYDWLGPSIDRATKELWDGVNKDLPYWVACSAHPVICARKEQMELWKADIDRGLRALVEASETLGEGTLSNDIGSGVAAYMEWVDVWVPKMFGAHAVGEAASAMSEFAEWAAKWDPLAPAFKAIHEEAMRFVKTEFPKEFALFEKAKNPASYLTTALGADTARQVIADMHMGPAPDSLLDWRKFEPLYNSVIMAKLALLDGDGLNELSRRAGITTPLFPPGAGTNVMIGFMRMLDGNDQWVPASVYGQPYVAYSSGGTPVKTSIGLGPRTASQPSGLPFFADSVAREKVFKIIFKGFGPGPGSDIPMEDVTIVRLPTRGDGHSALGRSREQIDRMRDLVAIIEKKIGGRAEGAAGVAAPRIGAAAIGGARAAASSWTERCCSRELAELRDAERSLVAANVALRRAPALGGRVGRAALLGAELEEVVRPLTAAIDRLAAATDAASAGSALQAISIQLGKLSDTTSSP